LTNYNNNNGGCGENAKCINTIGSYSCECEEGYSKDGNNCNPTPSFSTENQNQQAVGIGVGVTFGLLALILLALLILFFIRKRNVLNSRFYLFLNFFSFPFQFHDINVFSFKNLYRSKT